MTALKYGDDILVPVVQLLVDQTGLTFQDDNSRPHRARIVADYVQQQGIQTLPWTARSPDLSSIEHLLDELGRRTYARHNRIRTRQQLEQALRQEWKAIPQRTVRNVINSMRSRVIACIYTNGDHTRYWCLENNISCSYPCDLKLWISCSLWKWLWRLIWLCCDKQSKVSQAYT